MRKGFTLIELLAVIVILAIIALIATPIVLGIINDAKESATIRSADFYIGALQNQIALENMKLGGTFNPSYCDIVNGNITCEGIQEPLELKVDGEIPNSGRITFEDGLVTSVNLTYTSGTITMNSKGELVLGEGIQVCTLVEGEANKIGSKYQCKVKDNMETGFENGYYFYVLSQNEDGTTNLIMDRNIPYAEVAGDVEWIAGEWISDPIYGCGETVSYCAINDKGPVTAISDLHNATKDWNNVPNIVMNYTDEGNKYGSIKTNGTTTTITNKSGEETLRIENLKARMPRYDEVYGEGKCTTNDGSCPLWLVNYLLDSEYYTVENGKINVESYGYWTLSSDPEIPRNARAVIYDGMMYSQNISLDDWLVDIRPVITVGL